MSSCFSHGLKKSNQKIHFSPKVSSHSIFYIQLLLSETGFEIENKLLKSAFIIFLYDDNEDIFNICITCVVYEVRRKGIIYS